MNAGCTTHIVAGLSILLPLSLCAGNPLTYISGKFNIKDGVC